MTRRQLPPIADRGPLRVMFLLTSMPVGGAETLLVNLMRQLDRERFSAELCCLKTLGPLGEALAVEFPAFHGLLRTKYDVFVLPRLVRLFRERQADAVVTVGAGDKMFWGRIAAAIAGVPVVLSALHSTGWPDGVGRLNRRLTRLTDGFIAVAEEHGRFLREFEQFPSTKVFVIPNGVDTTKFSPAVGRSGIRPRYDTIVDTTNKPLVGIVAALRPEKNHELFLRVADHVRGILPEARFLIVGDGPEREKLVAIRDELRLREHVAFLGTRSDIPTILADLDVFLLTSHNEANPVSILEAMACGKPVVAPNVGSIAEAVDDERTGFLTTSGKPEEIAGQVLSLLNDKSLAKKMGQAGRESVVAHWSLDRMVRGYEDLITAIYSAKCPRRAAIAERRADGASASATAS